MSVVPSYDDFSALEKLFVAKREDGCWKYHTRFVETVGIVTKRGLSRFKQAGYARKMASNMTTTILSYKPFQESRDNIELLTVAYVMLEEHVKRLNLKLPKNHDTLVYAVWYLDKNMPKVDAV